ncbi:hypothetical protein B0H14DRAFT_463334 [Mycena olivaceomarginata]|nr:hypothetical protein B0H14DRAFT_463334 [Mycena olivaceomarginata]
MQNSERLKEVIPLLEKLLWRHGKCGYKPLRDYACPSKVKALQREDVDSSGILELISEHTSSAPRTQKSLTDISLDSEGNSILPAGLTQAALHAQTKPRFVEYSCSHIEGCQACSLRARIEADAPTRCIDMRY